MTMRMKKCISLLLAAVLSLALFSGCGGSSDGTSAGNSAGDTSSNSSNSTSDAAPAASGDVITLKVGHDAAETVPIAKGLAEFERLVEERTDGAVQVEVYNNGTMGSASDYVVNCQLGTLDMGASNQSVIASFIPELAACDIPYIFESYEHADAAFTGELADYFIERVRNEMQLEVVAIWEVGFRNLTNSKHAVNTVADVAGLRLRTMDNPIHIAFWQSLGADPVPMSWSEAYTALQQKALDGQENPYSVILGNNVAEVNKYIAVTEHVYSSQFIFVSQQAWSKMTAEQQEIVRTAAVEAGQYEREEQRRQADEAVAQLEAAGMEFTYPDKNEFIAATEEFRASASADYPDVVAMIDRAKESLS